MAIRNEYARLGVGEFYSTVGDGYSNPHFEVIRSLLEGEVPEDAKILDLCAGTGEVTRIFPANEIVGCDPYLNGVYERRTGRRCYPYSFDEICAGKLQERFDTVICSFALHLCEPSKLNLLLFQIARIAEELIVVTPHKRPKIDGQHWIQVSEELKDRVRLRRYLRGAIGG